MKNGSKTEERNLERIEALDSSFRRPAVNMFSAEILVGAPAVLDLLENLEDLDADVRADAAYALGRIGDVKAATALKALLADADGEVRTQAAVALIRLGDENLLPQVVKSLHHKDPRVVLGAAVILGRMADPRVVPNLVEAFQTQHDEVGAAVAWALGQCKDVACLPWLCGAVQSGFCTANACEALGRIGSENAAEVLWAKLDDKTDEVRVYAARSLGMLRFTDAKKKLQTISALKKSLKDSTRKVRICAALSLNDLGEKSAKSSLSDEVNGLLGEKP